MYLFHLVNAMSIFFIASRPRWRVSCHAVNAVARVACFVLVSPRSAWSRQRWICVVIADHECRALNTEYHGKGEEKKNQREAIAMHDETWVVSQSYPPCLACAA